MPADPHSPSSSCSEKVRSLTERPDLVWHAPIGVFISTPAGRFTFANPAMARLYGYQSPHELIDSVTDIREQIYADPADRDFFTRQIKADGTLFNHECRFRRPDGSTFWAQRTVKAITSDHGAITYYHGFITDVSDRVRAEEEREKLQGQLNQAKKMESVSRLAGGVAHHFNNMLSVILGYSELALAEVAPGEPVHAALQSIRQAAQRSVELTRQLLSYAGREIATSQPVDLNVCLTGMLPALEKLLGEKATLVWHPGGDLGAVQIDPAHIDQILVELAVNARDYLGDRGLVTIETGNVHLDSGFHRIHPEAASGDYVLLAVSDNGCGMDAATRANLFEPFFTTKGMDQGRGLGLFTVYGLVKQHGGFISVYSEPGLGTTFKLYFPRAEASSPAVQVATGEEGQMVLLVEDQADARGRIAGTLEELGYQVLAAASSREAINLVTGRADRFALLLTDVTTSDMLGSDLAKILGYLNPRLRCLFMSDHSAAVSLRQGLLEQGEAFIQKPFAKAELAETLRLLLAAPASASPGEATSAGASR
jgi:two-component system, cell cycle sensor histidine kinase and response regulator CckA